MTEAEAKTYVGTHVTPEQFDKLKLLIELLRGENIRQNLVSRETLEVVWSRHIADSLQLARFCEPNKTCADLGSGAGFPGLVLAIAQPEMQFELIESRNLRIEWIRQAISSLELLNCRAVKARVERHTGSFDVITARAFAPLTRLIAASERLTHKGSIWVLPKGRGARDEVKALGRRDLVFHVEQSITDPDSAILIGQYR